MLNDNQIYSMLDFVNWIVTERLDLLGFPKSHRIDKRENYLSSLNRALIAEMDASPSTDVNLHLPRFKMPLRTILDVVS